MDTLKTSHQSEAASEKASEKKIFLKYREILKDYKSERNPLKMLEAHFRQRCKPSICNFVKK